MKHTTYQNYLVLILLLLPRCQQLQPTCRTCDAELIYVIQRHFWSGCVFLTLLQDGRNNDLLLKWHVIQLQLHLSEWQVPTAILDTTYINSTALIFTCRRNRALHVILSSGKSTWRYLHQLFAKPDVSEPRWLLFVDNTSRVEDFLSAVNIPFDCEFLVAVRRGSVELTEAFRVSRALPLQTAHWGSWSRRDGLRAPAGSLYRRRNDLQGIVLNASTYDDPPFNVVKKGNDGIIHVEGLFPEMCREMSQDLNFSLNIFEVDSEDYNTSRENDTWGGEIGMLLREELHLTLTEEYMTAATTGVVSYSIPLSESKSCIYIRTPERLGSQWTAMLSPFSSSLWLAVGGSIISIACYLALLHKLAQILIHLDQQYLNGFSLPDCLLCVWGAFCAQAYYRTPYLWSGRLVHWTRFVMAYIMLAAYSAHFISDITARKVDLPFKSLQGILQDDSYEFGVVLNSELYSNFKDANDRIIQEIYTKKILPIKNSLPDDELIGFQQTCERRFAFMADCEYFTALQDTIPCDLSVLPEASFPLISALMLPKGGPYRGIFNFRLRMMKRSGLLRRQLLKTRPRRFPGRAVTPLRSIELGDVIPLLSLCAGGCLLGVAVMFCRTAIARRHMIVPRPVRR